MAANTPMLLSKKSQEAIIMYLQQCYNQYTVLWNLRERMLLVDRQYAREMDLTTENARAKTANTYGDANRFQNIELPVVMPQVEAAVTYQTSVFLTGTPLFGVGAAPEYQNEALQLETKIDSDAIRGGWTRHFTMFFRDGAKYNIGAIEVCWDKEVTAAIDTDLNFSATQGKPKEIIWEGNKVKRLDMYNTIFDTRVAPAEMHEKGEFVGYTELASRITLKKLINTLPDVRLENVVAAFEAPSCGISFTQDTSALMSYYVPQVNPNVPIIDQFQGAFNWEAWAGITSNDRKIDYKNLYQVTTLYARILPSDFGIKVPAANTPQVWKFIIVNYSVLIYAERLTNAHGLIPVLFSQPLEDGLTYQTKSLATNVAPIQAITSAISNANIAARRRAISDRVLYDPSRITEAHINSSNPSAKIPVRPAAYGKPVGESVYAFPFRDDQSVNNAQQISLYTSMANTISGQNPVRQGQFVKGNKTQSEFDSVMANANGRDQVTALGYEAQIFTPLKEIVKINTLQYTGGVSLYNREKKVVVKIDPVQLRKAVMEFKVSDGLTPLDKIMDTDTMIVAMQQIGSSPAIGGAYNVGPMFSYLMKLKGADLSPFEKSPEQQAYEAALREWQMLIMEMSKNNPEIKADQFPPRPLPEQFGYVPAGSGVPKKTES